MIATRRPKRVSTAVFGSLVLLSGLAGCGGGSSAAVAPPAPSAAPSAAPTIGVISPVTPIQLTNGLAPTPATATIRMYIDHPFSPATLTVAPGTNITVINEGTGNEVCNLSDPDHGLNSNDIGAGASTHVIAPDTPGTYNYKCTYYPDTMKGTLIVSKDTTTPSSAEPVTASPTPTGAPTSAPTAPASGTGGSTSGGTDTGGSTSGGSSSGGTDTGGSDTGGGDDTISDGSGGSTPPTFDPVKRAHNCTKPHFRETHPGICSAYPS